MFVLAEPPSGTAAVIRGRGCECSATFGTHPSGIGRLRRSTRWLVGHEFGWEDLVGRRAAGFVASAVKLRLLFGRSRKPRSLKLFLLLFVLLRREALLLMFKLLFSPFDPSILEPHFDLQAKATLKDVSVLFRIYSRFLRKHMSPPGLTFNWNLRILDIHTRRFS